MSSWTQTAESTEYRDALEATEELDAPAQGFVRPSRIQGGQASSLTAVLKQNNTIIQLLVKISERLDDCILDLKNLKNKAEKGKEVDLEDSIQDLTKKLEKVSLGGTITEPVKKSKGPFYVFTDPLKIYENEKKKSQK